MKPSIPIDKRSPIDPPCIHNCPSDNCPSDNCPTDPHKVVVDTLWDRLSDDAKAAIARMVEALPK
jgi:hypothetical protein